MIKPLINRSRGGDDALGPKMALRARVSNDASLELALPLKSFLAARLGMSIPTSRSSNFPYRFLPALCWLQIVEKSLVSGINAAINSSLFRALFRASE
jgi:hypothetical protein